MTLWTFILCIALAAIPAAAHAKFDPSYEWTVLESPHFLIHYHQGGEVIAKRAAVIAEDIHARLTPRMRWTPEERTRIVLVDAMDEANGMASPIPFNQIILYLTQPSGPQGFGLTSYDDWLRLVLTHEYTHVLQLDMVTGGPKTVQNIFGRIYFPNMFQPVWMIEGLATYEETELTTGGRGRSPGAEMVIRTAVLENAFPTLGQAQVFPDSWPSGQVPYLFGEGFTRYIAEKYGREKVAEISTVYSGRSFPFLVGSTAERTIGREYAGLWSEWEESLRVRYRKELAAIIQRPLTLSTPRTDSGFVTTSPRYSPLGGQIAYAAVEGDEYPGIYLMDSDGAHVRKLTENWFPVSASGTGLAWSHDGQSLVYTKLEIVRNTAAYNDLYAADIAKGRETRLTTGLRARDPHISADGQWMVFVQNRMGMTRLALLKDPLAPRERPAGEREIVPLTPWGIEQYETPRFSPEGNRIAVGIWLPGGRRDIRILDTGGRLLDEVTEDRAVDCGPAWSADGKFLYFSSDRTGIFNLYAYETETRQLWQVSNVTGGAFAPSPSPDNTTLAFANYSSRGYDVHTMAVDRAAWMTAEPPIERYPAALYDEKPVATTSSPYSPASTVYPRFWLPWFGYSHESGTLVGGMTYGQDVIQRHQYLATVLYGPKNGRVWYDIDYFYDGMCPTVHLHASDNDTTYGNFLHDLQGSKDYVERDRTLGAALILPVLKMASQHAFTAGLRWKDLSNLSDLPPWPGYAGPLPARGVLASGRLVYTYNSSRRYPFSISPEQGRAVEFGSERFAEALGSDFQYTKYSADWYEFLNFPWKHHVLLARAFGGTSTGTTPPQGAYQLGGDNPGDITLSLVDRSVMLRGYPANVMHGRKAVLGSLEYRFPISLLEKGWDTKPFYYRKFHGAVFFEAGNAWDGNYNSQDLRRSVGAEARLDMDFAYYLPLTFRFVFARGLDEEGDAQVYVGLWVPLEL